MTVFRMFVAAIVEGSISRRDSDHFFGLGFQSETIISERKSCLQTHAKY